MHILKNFKNFGEAELDLMRPLTLLIGRNGSGKSNLVEGVELLAQLAHGRPLHEITDVGRGSGSTFEVRGGLLGCIKYDKKKISEIGKFSLGFDADWQGKFHYSITISLRPQSVISEEKLLWKGRVIYTANLNGHTDILEVQYDNFKRGKNKPTTNLPADRSVLSRYGAFANQDSSNQNQKDAQELARVIEQHLNAAFVFDLNPKLMRNYERIGDRLLVKDGSNISSVLYGLHKLKDVEIIALMAGADLGEQWNPSIERILQNLKQLPEESFETFEFVQTSLNDVLLALKYSDGTLIDARQLSDGTLRTLAILTALETVPEFSKIIIEELDNGIHPSRVKILVDAIWECGKRRNLNVLATTHNPATLNCLSGEQLEAVVLCHYDQEKKSSTLTPLLDLPRADVLLERGGLGDLVTRQVIDQYLAPNFEEKQKQKAKAWLESLS